MVHTHTLMDMVPIHTPMLVPTTLERDPLMLSLTMVMAVVMAMEDIDMAVTDTVATTEESDLLMLNPTTGMAVVMAMEVMAMADMVMDMVAIMDKKSISYGYFNFLN